MDWAYLFKIGIALFAIVNPIGSVPIFISATDGWEQKQKMRTANVVAVTVFLVLGASALFGEGILDFFSISIFRRKYLARTNHRNNFCLNWCVFD
jgi:multiple antibiotic resistance protein